jgi:hypothetical protein
MSLPLRERAGLRDLACSFRYRGRLLSRPETPGEFFKGFEWTTDNRPPFDLAFKCNRHIHTNCIGKPLFQQEQVGIVLRSSWTRYRWPLDRRRPREGFCLSHGQTVLDDVTRNLSGVIGGNQRAGAPCGQGPADQHIVNHVR